MVKCTFTMVTKYSELFWSQCSCYQANTNAENKVLVNKIKINLMHCTGNPINMNDMKDYIPQISMTCTCIFVYKTK